MIDFHAHILYGLDDGAENLEQSLMLIDSLKKQGVDAIVAAPHFYFNNITEDGFFAFREQALAKVRKAEPDVKIVPACEVYISKSFPYTDFQRFQIGNTGYILVELPHHTSLSKHIYDILLNIINVHGLTPIVAHCERYPAVLSKPGIVAELIDIGCLIQINTSSLFSGALKNLALKMIACDQVHALGTDCHNDRRMPIYQDAVNLIRERFGEEKVERLQRNMELLLEGRRIEVAKPKKIKKFFKFYL